MRTLIITKIKQENGDLKLVETRIGQVECSDIPSLKQFIRETQTQIVNSEELTEEDRGANFKFVGLDFPAVDYEMPFWKDLSNERGDVGLMYIEPEPSGSFAEVSVTETRTTFVLFGS